MMRVLRMTQAQRDALKYHLVQSDGLESVALAVCGRSRSADRAILTVHELLPVPQGVCARTTHDVRWPTRSLYELMPRLASDDLAILKMHSHPEGCEGFSALDDKSDRELLSAVGRRCGDLHASAIMLPDARIIGRFVDAKGGFMPVDRIAVIGEDIVIDDKSAPDAERDFDVRHRQLFGARTTNLLARLTVGVVGASGTGSPLIEMLVRLGVRRMVIIDDDVVEAKNLNRIYGTTIADAAVRRFKVDALANHIRRIGLGTEVVTCAQRVGSPEAQALLAGCDAVFGCVDSAGGRDALNQTAARLILPYIDLGVRLEADGLGGVHGVSSAVHYLTPGGASLKTRGVYTDADVYAEALREQDPVFYRDQVERGYIRGVRVESPAVISINTLTAASAVNEFLARIHPFRSRSNQEFATQRLLVSHGRTVTYAEGEPDLELARSLGLGQSDAVMAQRAAA